MSTWVRFPAVFVLRAWCCTHGYPSVLLTCHRILLSALRGSVGDDRVQDNSDKRERVKVFICIFGHILILAASVIVYWVKQLLYVF